MAGGSEASGALDAQQLKDRLDIVEVVSEHVKLRKTGKNYVGLCPFHADSHPSFTVSPERGLFYCYGCQTGGDVITFVQKTENLTFVEAAERLARRIGARFAYRERDGERAASRQRLEALNRLAAVYYARLLRASQRAQGARDYIKARGISQASVEEFMLGFALPEWDDFRRAAESKGYTEAELVRAGLCIAREGGGGCYDRFRGRLMFPIFSAQGSVVGFGGRALGDDEPKYINSPETEIFEKGKLLYGLRQAAPAIKEMDTAVVVEGYTDVIACHECGVRNVVATLGTALTPDHLRLLRRYGSRVVMAFDADQAGIAAVMRNVGQLEATGMDVRVSLLPSGEDPDSIVRGAGADRFSELVDSAAPLVHFAVDQVIARFSGDPVRGRQRAAGEIVELLAGMRDEVALGEYVAYAATRLAGGEPARASQLEQALRHELRLARQREQRSKVRREGRSGALREEAALVTSAVAGSALEEVPRGVLRAERIALRCAADDPDVAREVFSILPASAFCDPLDRELAARAEEQLRARGRIDGRRLADGLGPEAVQRWAGILLDDFEMATDRDTAIACATEAADYRKRIRMRELESVLSSQEAKAGQIAKDVVSEYQELVRYFSDKTAQRSAL